MEDIGKKDKLVLGLFWIFAAWSWLQGCFLFHLVAVKKLPWQKIGAVEIISHVILITAAIAMIIRFPILRSKFLEFSRKIIWQVKITAVFLTTFATLIILAALKFLLG
ncbi:MAG: hypothetical protein PHO56_02410 [Patescibacteria group bacterium]|nr:hypothetical protein [Patescibacteria group bacterium]